MKRVGAIAVVLACVGCASTPSKPINVSLPAPTRALSELLEQLRSPEAESRAAAAWETAGAKHVAQSTVDALTALLDDPNRDVRYAAAWALGHVAKGKVFYHTAPRALRITRPSYPLQAYNNNVAGTVIIAILVGEEGEVAHTQVRVSIPALDQAALACVRDWRFEPATRDGKPMAAAVLTPVGFRIF